VGAAKGTKFPGAVVSGSTFIDAVSRYSARTATQDADPEPSSRSRVKAELGVALTHK
jgi:hypothetical protein